MTYITGFLTPVKNENRDRYIASAQASWPMFKKYGAIAQIENWGADVPDGKLTSFPLSVKLEAEESVVFSWIVWPDRATADKAWETMQTDPEMENMDMPFDGKRMMWGGFDTVFDSAKAG